MKLKSSDFIRYLKKIDTIFKYAIVNEGLRYGGKQKKFDDITTSKLINAAILKLFKISRIATAVLQQIIPNEFLNSKKNVVGFYIHPFEDLSPKFAPIPPHYSSLSHD